MKKTIHIMTAALLLTGALLTTACSNEEEAAVNINNAQTVTFTATLAPKGDNGGQTRAITTGTDANSKEVLNVTWAAGEKIALYYQTGPDAYAKAEATVDEVNDGVATISASLTNAMNGGTVKFVYPAWLANATGDDIDENKLLNNQVGYLSGKPSNTISKKFDAATGSGTIAVNNNVASVSGMVTMENRVCICKFNFIFTEDDLTVSTYVTTITLGSHTYTINDNNLASPIYLAMLPETSATGTITAVGYAGDPSFSTPKSRHLAMFSDVTLEAGKFYRNIPLSLTQTTMATRTLTTSDGEVPLQDGDIVSGKGGANTRLKIADGATVTLAGVTNTDITQAANIPGIECEGNATIILAGTNSITGHSNAAGIFVHEGKTLTIRGSGTLNATGGSDGAGIGGTKETSCGNIRIEGGTITATGTGECAGIGSGYAFDANITCGNITITGGTVTATGGKWAAGIGSGHANQANNTCGDITISGGTVTATGGTYAAGIGSGNGNAYDPNGSGNSLYYPSSCGAITITGGTVEATSGERAAGIGSGSDGRFASISIGSGIIRVTATRSNNYWNVPIGKGNEDQGNGAVTFDGVTMHDGREDYMDPSDWTNWPTDGQTYGGINVAVSAYSTEGLTWTLTPKN